MLWQEVLADIVLIGYALTCHQAELPPSVLFWCCLYVRHNVVCLGTLLLGCIHIFFLSVSVVQILKLWFTVPPVFLVDSPFQGEDSAFRVPSLWWAIEKTNKQEKQSWKASLKFQVKEYVWQKTPPISPSPGSSEDHCHLQSSLQVQQ